MKIQLTDQYSPEEISEARDEILKLQTNLTEIEELYKNLYSTLDNQQNHVQHIQTSINQTGMNLEKGAFDLHEILQIRKHRDKHRYLIISFILAIACFFFFIVLLVLINVIKTFAFKRILQTNK